MIRLLENFSKGTHIYGMAGIIGGKSQIERRLTMISLFKKGSYKGSALSVIVLLILGCIMLTNAEGKENSKNQEAVWQDIKQTYHIDEQEYYRIRTDFEENSDKDSKYAWKITGTKTVQGERKFINEHEKEQYMKNPAPDTTETVQGERKFINGSE